MYDISNIIEVFSCETLIRADGFGLLTVVSSLERFNDPLVDNFFGDEDSPLAVASIDWCWFCELPACMTGVCDE